jgi:ABC-type dipeptide/oligopeptide/nickel transport system ATPase component
MTSRVLVMHQGLLVEQGDTASVFAAPKDPYTDRLVSSAKRSAMALRELTGGPR